jgi:7-cyano-7-deazaguanine synthase
LEPKGSNIPVFKYIKGIHMDKLCVISMSGGLDSSTLAFKAIEDGFKILPININYGQKNLVEQHAFKKVLAFFQRNFPDQVLDPINIDLTTVMKTSLKTWQKLRDSGGVQDKTELEFYTPSRNLLFSVMATMIGEIAAMANDLKEVRVGLGVHKHETYKNYWDITPTFVKKLNELLELNDCVKISMYAPYKDFTKKEIIQDAIRLGLPYELTWTCYNPVTKQTLNGIRYKPCLKCEACHERQKAGDELGVTNINDYTLNI